MNWFSILLLFLLVSCSSQVVVIGSIPIRVEIADVPLEWSCGLQFRESLGVDEGVLFVFPVERSVSFWMKDVFFLIDMIFVNGAGKVVGVEHSVPPCKTDPCLRYQYDGVKYVLEVSAGLAEKEGIEIGSILKIRK